MVMVRCVLVWRNPGDNLDKEQLCCASSTWDIAMQLGNMYDYICMYMYIHASFALQI